MKILKICVGTCCHLLGSYELVDKLNEMDAQRLYDVKIELTTCINSCQSKSAQPPYAEFNGKIIENANIDKILNCITAT